MLTISIAIHNPDLVMWKQMIMSLNKFTPELSQLIIVDNASESKEWLAIVEQCITNKVKKLYLVQSENLGFGEAHNIALERAEGRFFAVLNDDIEFFENWSTEMIRLFETDTKIAQVGIRNGTCNMLTPLGKGYGIDTDNPDYCEGSCFMTYTKLAKDIGLFLPEYEFGYFEDTDFSLRLKKAGYKITNTLLKWVHYRAKTSSKAIVDIRGYHVKNEYTFRKKWGAYLIAKRFGKLIVVRRTASIGDVFLTIPIIKALKKQYQDCAIVLMTSNPQAIAHNPLIDYVCEQPYAPLPCDVFIDLDNSYERDFTENIVDRYAYVAGLTEPLTKKTGVFAATEEQIGKIKRLMPVIKKKLVALDVSTTWSSKQWAYDKYRELAKHITKLGWGIVLIGKKDDYGKDFIDADYDFVNQLDIPMTTLAIARCQLYIGHEGLILHLVQAINKPSIGLYGCTLPEFTNDMNSKTLIPVITKAVCKGCRHRHMAGNMVVCPRNSECMGMISVEDVIKAFDYSVNKFFIEGKNENVVHGS